MTANVYNKGVEAISYPRHFGLFSMLLIMGEFMLFFLKSKKMEENNQLFSRSVFVILGWQSFRSALIVQVYSQADWRHNLDILPAWHKRAHHWSER